MENNSFNSPIIAPLRETGLAGLAGPGPRGGPPGGPPGGPGGAPGAGGAFLGGGPGGPPGAEAAAEGAEAAGLIPEPDFRDLMSLFTEVI